mgnify:CR=1 FL=1
MFRSLRALFAPSTASPTNASADLCATKSALAAALPEQGQLNIPVARSDRDDLIGHSTIEHGRYLARQDRWAELSQEMRVADQGRAAVSDGRPVADLLAFGARSDVVLAAEHALSDGKAISDYDLLGGISELEGEMADNPDDPMIATVVSLAHIDLAWAWRGTASDATLPP